MRIERVILREIRLPFRNFFETSFGRTYDKEAILIEVVSEGLSGWGECVACEGPFYSYEDRVTAWHVLKSYLAPSLVDPRGTDPDHFLDHAPAVRGHPMAKAAVEAALFDLQARQMDTPLWLLLGGTRERIPCGVSIGIQDGTSQLLDKIHSEKAAGYQKFKLKIKPGWDVEILDLVRREFPDIPLMVDANAAYSAMDFPHLKTLDQFGLMMIEQPLFYDDLYEHSRLQEQIETRLCLDESIRHNRDAELALRLKSCRIINVKFGRVGGLREAIRIHDLCLAHGVPVWCGGMLETGIGRAHNVALSTLANFKLPGDVSASARYFERDTIWPAVEVDKEGFITPPSGAGIGYEPDREWIERITIQQEMVS